jgi:hypothetical protein
MCRNVGRGVRIVQGSDSLDNQLPGSLDGAAIIIRLR